MPYKDKRDPRLLAYRQQKAQRIITRNREYVWELKRGPCIDCGQTFHPCVMDYDHVRGEKAAGVGYLMGSASLKKVQEEIDKCELVCSNCHRLRTFDRLTNED